MDHFYTFWEWNKKNLLNNIKFYRFLKLSWINIFRTFYNSESYICGENKILRLLIYILLIYCENCSRLVLFENVTLKTYFLKQIVSYTTKTQTHARSFISFKEQGTEPDSTGKSTVVYIHLGALLACFRARTWQHCSPMLPDDSLTTNFLHLFTEIHFSSKLRQLTFAMSTAFLTAVAVILCVLFRLLNVNSTPLKPQLWCTDVSFMDCIFKIAPMLREP